MLAKNDTSQVMFYHYILDHYEIAQKVRPDFFENEVLRECFRLAKDHVEKYHTAPSEAQLKQLVDLDGKFNENIGDYINILYAQRAMLNAQTDQWLYDYSTTWAQWNNFTDTVFKVATYAKLEEDNIGPENIKEILEKAKSMFNSQYRLDFDGSASTGSDFWNAESHKQKQMKRESTGYPFLDLCLGGGYYEGALICFVGGPKIGKSLWLQNLCAKSVLAGENCSYISLELPEEMIHARIGSNIFNIPSSMYKDVAEDDVKFKKIMQNYRKGREQLGIVPGALDVKQFPTSTMSVLDLEDYLLAKEEELSTPGRPFKFKRIYLDYINIMRNYRNPNSENTYMKIKQLAEDVKAMAIKNHWTVITATQTNRSAFDMSDIVASQVSESAALNATVDLLMGIIADQMMKANGVYYLKCLLDRVAPEDNKRKKFLVEKEFLRIVEDPTTMVEDTYAMAPPVNGMKPQYPRKGPDPYANMQPATAQMSDGPAQQQTDYSKSANMFNSESVTRDVSLGLDANAVKSGSESQDIIYDEPITFNGLSEFR